MKCEQCDHIILGVFFKKSSFPYVIDADGGKSNVCQSNLLGVCLAHGVYATCPFWSLLTFR